MKRSWRQTLVSIDFLPRNPSDDAVRHPETKGVVQALRTVLDTVRID